MRDLELELIRKAQAGCQESTEQLLQMNEGLIHKIARSHWKPHDFDYEDMVQITMLGVLDAIQRFDPKYGRRLFTFAHWRVYRWMTTFRTNLDRGMDKSELTENTQPSYEDRRFDDIDVSQVLDTYEEVLTPAQISVMRQIREGKTHKQIAESGQHGTRQNVTNTYHMAMNRIRERYAHPDTCASDR